MNLRLIYLYAKSAKGTQQYNVTHAPCQLWLSRAAEIEVQSVVEHLTQGKPAH